MCVYACLSPCVRLSISCLQHSYDREQERQTVSAILSLAENHGGRILIGRRSLGGRVTSYAHGHIIFFAGLSSLDDVVRRSYFCPIKVQAHGRLPVRARLRFPHAIIVLAVFRFVCLLHHTSSDVSRVVGNIAGNLSHVRGLLSNMYILPVPCSDDQEL